MPETNGVCEALSFKSEILGLENQAAVKDKDYLEDMNFNRFYTMAVNPNSCFSILFVDPSLTTVPNVTSIDISLDVLQPEYLIYGQWQAISYELINLIGSQSMSDHNQTLLVNVSTFVTNHEQIYSHIEGMIGLAPCSTTL